MVRSLHRVEQCSAPSTTAAAGAMIRVPHALPRRIDLKLAHRRAPQTRGEHPIVEVLVGSTRVRCLGRTGTSCARDAPPRGIARATVTVHSTDTVVRSLC